MSTVSVRVPPPADGVAAPAEVAVPFCEDCDKFWSPNSMPPDGTCPSCGRSIAEPPASRRAPWHFWVLVAALVVYLGWRAVQGIEWVVGR